MKFRLPAHLRPCRFTFTDSSLPNHQRPVGSYTGLNGQTGFDDGFAVLKYPNAGRFQNTVPLARRSLSNVDGFTHLFSFRVMR